MKTMLRVLMLSASLLPLLATAQTDTPRIDQRQLNQAQRIEQGVTSGALTAREAGRLERQEGRIENMESKAKADGRVTAKERHRLRQAQKNESQRIYRQKHDAQHDFNHNGRTDRRRRG